MLARIELDLLFGGAPRGEEITRIRLYFAH